MQYLVLKGEEFKIYDSFHKRGLVGLLPFRGDIVWLLGMQQIVISPPFPDNIKHFLVIPNEWMAFYRVRSKKTNEELSADQKINGTYLAALESGKYNICEIYDVYRVDIIHDYNGGEVIFRPSCLFDRNNKQLLSCKTKKPLSPEQIKLFTGTLNDLQSFIGK